MDIVTSNPLLAALGTLIFRLIAAFLVLLIGWLIARWLGKLVTKLLHKLNLDERCKGWAGDDEKLPRVEEGVGKITYYFLMLFVLVAFFEVLGLTIITEPLNAMLAIVFAYLPHLIAAGALAVAAWIVAAILRGLTRRLLSATNVDKKVGEQAGEESVSISKALSEAVYWLIWLIFLPAILGALGLEALVEPLIAMFTQALEFIPQLVAAAVILIVGWFIAKIIRRIVTSFLVAIGTDEFSNRVGLGKILGKQNLSGLLGLLTFIIILIPVVIAALDALDMTALTAPLTAMLVSIFTAIPVMLAAFAILVVAYVVGKLLGDLAANILEGFGFNNILKFLGLTQKESAGGKTPSQIVGYIVLLAIMILASLSATSLLNLPALSLVIVQFLSFSWQIIIGLVIFGLGLWLAQLIVAVIDTTEWPHKRLAIIFTRIAVIALATSMALAQMGLADTIINLAFGLIVGGIALAAALAFGLGGRETAGRELEGWVEAVHEEGVIVPVEAQNEPAQVQDEPAQAPDEPAQDDA